MKLCKQVCLSPRLFGSVLAFQLPINLYTTAMASWLSFSFSSFLSILPLQLWILCSLQTRSHMLKLHQHCYHCAWVIILRALYIGFASAQSFPFGYNSQFNSIQISLWISWCSWNHNLHKGCMAMTSLVSYSRQCSPQAVMTSRSASIPLLIHVRAHHTLLDSLE